ncbi:MAG: helix-turn-helix domain-containing protein [Chloroflexota bacterium]|nr:helix-turn-helix domain-containing protein [Chloroflexota bacterium]MDQ5865250.1 helix-turn-helix domain-containing protein [Chloroflexota bacterium]
MITTISARVLGQRIRQLRTHRGLIQQDLAGEDYSKSYISAIEQGKTRPSLEALQRIASRLEVAAGQLLDPDASGFVPADPESMPRHMRRRRGLRAGERLDIFDWTFKDFEISQAELYLHMYRSNQALEMLRSMLPEETGIEGTDGYSRPQRSSESQQRAYYLAAMAAIHFGNAAEALGYVQKGMQFAARLSEVERFKQVRLLDYAQIDLHVSRAKRLLHASRADILLDSDNLGLAEADLSASGFVLTKDPVYVGIQRYQECIDSPASENMWTEAVYPLLGGAPIYIDVGQLLLDAIRAANKTAKTWVSDSSHGRTLFGGAGVPNLLKIRNLILKLFKEALCQVWFRARYANKHNVSRTFRLMRSWLLKRAGQISARHQHYKIIALPILDWILILVSVKFKHKQLLLLSPHRLLHGPQVCQPVRNPWLLPVTHLKDLDFSMFFRRNRYATQRT